MFKRKPVSPTFFKSCGVKLAAISTYLVSSFDIELNKFSKSKFSEARFRFKEVLQDNPNRNFFDSSFVRDVMSVASIILASLVTYKKP
jgi:hypothetical protein